jgi:hypothetical protein
MHIDEAPRDKHERESVWQIGPLPVHRSDAPSMQTPTLVPLNSEAKDLPEKAVWDPSIDY